MEAEMLTVNDVARELNRTPSTARYYYRTEGLPFVRVGRSGRMVVSRDAFEEWRSRPEIQAMLFDGDAIKVGRAAKLATA